MSMYFLLRLKTMCNWLWGVVGILGKSTWKEREKEVEKSGCLFLKPRRKACLQKERQRVLAGAWGVPNKQSECVSRTKRD